MSQRNIFVCILVLGITCRVCMGFMPSSVRQHPILFGLTTTANAGSSCKTKYHNARIVSSQLLDAVAPITESFIQTELRGAAMKLHTRQQAPKEGQAEGKTKTPYTPTHSDYLSFLIDSYHVYEAMEEIVNTKPELADFRNTGLERTVGLAKDIEYMITEYQLTKPEVGTPGTSYATLLRQITSVPEFMCHYYNFHFAHTAGGRMIGKQMSVLLLNKKTLEFYTVSIVFLLKCMCSYYLCF